jgi:hypothetical protein
MSNIEIDIETNIDYAKIYKGKYFNKSRSSKKYQKVLVFDLDETLGSFIDLEILWRAITEYKTKNRTIEFFELLDLYPEFLRYGIIPILEYLNQKKNNGDCSKVYIYTNNQCPDDWTVNISEYFNKKLLSDNDIFDRVICAFKINNNQIELARTTHEKTHNDFINCTLLPPTTEICFVDNTYFTGMRKERVYYIQPKSYNHHLSTNEIIDRFIYSRLSSKMISTKTELLLLRSYLINFFKRRDRFLIGNPTFKQLETDIYVAQKMMYHIKEFFFLTQCRKSRTRKMKIKLGRFTRKNITKN